MGEESLRFPYHTCSQPWVLYVSADASAKSKMTHPQSWHSPAGAADQLTQPSAVPSLAGCHSPTWPGLCPNLALTQASVCSRLAQPGLHPDPALTYVTECCSPALTLSPGSQCSPAETLGSSPCSPARTAPSPRSCMCSGPVCHARLQSWHSLVGSVP